MQAAAGAHNRARDMPAMQEEAEYLRAGLRSHSFSSQFLNACSRPTTMCASLPGCGSKLLLVASGQ